MKQINATNCVQLKKKTIADEKTPKSWLKIILDNINMPISNKHSYVMSRQLEPIAELSDSHYLAHITPTLPAYIWHSHHQAFSTSY